MIGLWARMRRWFRRSDEPVVFTEAQLEYAKQASMAFFLKNNPEE